jgi:tellurite resistance protein
LSLLNVLLVISVGLNLYFLAGQFKRRSAGPEKVDGSLAEGLRHSDTRVVLMTVLMTLAARVAMKDGKVLTSEKEVLTSNLGLTQDTFAFSNTMFEEAAEIPVSEQELAELINKIYPSLEERRKVVEFLNQIAMADGEYHEKERSYIETVKALLDL